MKTNRIQFSLEKYQSGKYKVVTRDGRRARIVCTDLKDRYPIIAAISDSEVREYISSYPLDGKLWNDNRESLNDLFLEEPIFEDGDIVSFGYTSTGTSTGIFKKQMGSTHSNYITIDSNSELEYIEDGWTNDKIRLSTEEECKRLFDALKKDGKRWNSKNKCIEDIKKDCQFKPFDKVLVRNSDFSMWYADIFSYLYEGAGYPYRCIGGEWEQCIPYEGNEKLLGTNTSK